MRDETERPGMALFSLRWKPPIRRYKCLTAVHMTTKAQQPLVGWLPTNNRGHLPSACPGVGKEGTCRKAKEAAG